MLTLDGRCKTLDAIADGYVRTEAVGALLLHSIDSLSNSWQQVLVSASDSVAFLIIMGTAVNQDGRSSSLTAPNGPSQSSLISAALETSRLPGSKVHRPIGCQLVDFVASFCNRKYSV
jgi:acyl transferase domain-containing protein